MNASEIKIIESDVKNSHYYPDDYSPCNTCINHHDNMYEQMCLTCAYFYKSNYSPRHPDKVISQILGSKTRKE